MFETLLNFDYQIFAWVNQTGSFALGDQIFPAITDLHKNPYFQIFIVPILLTVFYKKFKKLGFILFLFLGLAMGCGDFVGAQVKNHFNRPRPFENVEINSIQKSPAGSKSFYSNHASNMFTFASFASTFFPSAQAPLYGLALLVSYSRIYNGVHYPSDVFAGAIMGLVWGYLFSWIAKKTLFMLQNRKNSAA